MSGLTFEEKVEKAYGGVSRYEEIIKACTLAEIKQLLATKSIRIPKVFRDGVDPDRVATYSDGLSTIDCMRLAQYLQTQEYSKRKNLFDLSSYVTDGVQSITIGRGTASVTAKNLAGQVGTMALPVQDGAIGGLDVEYAAAVVIAACSKVHKDADPKSLNYHEKNEYAPQSATCASLASITTMKEFSNDNLLTQALDIKKASVAAKVGAIEMINLGVPRVKITEGERTFVRPVVNFLYDPNDPSRNNFTYKTDKPKNNILIGDYEGVAAKMTQYMLGMGYPAIKRSARNLWTGTPSDGLSPDHIVALHDAGVKDGDDLLVVTADSNLISAIKSNFGARVFGIGRGDGYISESDLRRYKFKWVYYPEPFGLSPSGTFLKSFADTHTKMIKYLKTQVSGKVIMHVSPLVFYCLELCKVLDLDLTQFNKEKKTIINLTTEGPVEAGQNYKASKEVTFAHVLPPQIDAKSKIPLVTDVHFAQYYQDHPTIGMKILSLKTDTYTLMNFDMMHRIRVPLKLTLMSFHGTMLYVEDGPGISMGQALGRMGAYSRDVFKSIWVPFHRSENSYEIRRIVKGAMLDDINWADEWSAMYTPAVRKAAADEADEETEERLKVSSSGGSADSDVISGSARGVRKEIEIDLENMDWGDSFVAESPSESKSKEPPKEEKKAEKPADERVYPESKTYTHGAKKKKYQRK